MNTKVKICGIKTPDMAYFCATAGAQFIGIVLHPESARYVDLKTAVLIAQAAKKADIIPVAVFVDADKDLIVEVCRTAKIDHVQLHGDLSRNALPDLPNDIHKIYVGNFDKALCLNSQKDYLLFDGPIPGTGQTIDWNKIKVPQAMRFFLAGGLTAANVRQAIATVHPFAVDVSSGVESSRGEKSHTLIQAFIKQVHHG
jgi:phosphoribosylanthranilate isomerase